MFGSPIARLRILGRIEGVTLLTLIGIAVPLKHLAGEPTLVTLLGPLHGAVFLLYLLHLGEVAAGGGWSRGEIGRTALVSVLPSGTFLNDAFLRRKQAVAKVTAATL